MKISIGKRKLAKGRTALYLCIHSEGKRTRKNLGIILDKPINSDIKQANRQKMEFATCMRAKYEIKILQANWEKPESEVKNILQLWKSFETSYTSADHAVVHAVGLHLEQFTQRLLLLPSDLTPVFCTDFWQYLHTRCGLHGHTPAGYFGKFRQFLGHLVREGLLTDNPARDVRTQSHTAHPKKPLTFKELQLLAETPCSNTEVKELFLFACNTGLRWSDVSRLTLANICPAEGIMQFTQQKVASHSKAAAVVMKLNPTALTLALRAIRRRGAYAASETPLFTPPSYNRSLQILNQWVQNAGINKHITLHCARHTFITNLISLNVNLSTVAMLAGHSTTRHTEGYVHLNEEICAAAVNKLPPIKL